MKKLILLSLLLMSLIFLSACDGIDISNLSDEDLERISNKAIVCNSPYIRFEMGCCLDNDNNSVCDKDEGANKDDINSEKDSNHDDKNNPNYSNVDSANSNSDINSYDDTELIQEAKLKNLKAKEYLNEANGLIESNQKLGIDVDNLINLYKDTKHLFDTSLDSLNDDDYKMSIHYSSESLDLSKKIIDKAKHLHDEFIDNKYDEKDEFNHNDDGFTYSDIKLEAEKKSEGIVLEWNKYTGSGFKGYKIVRSNDNENLKYPNDGYIKYITDVSETRFVDSDVFDSDSLYVYYVITVLTEKESVYSNSVKFELGNNSVDDSESEDNNGNENLSSSIE
jgi:hypothetical protein